MNAAATVTAKTGHGIPERPGGVIGTSVIG